MSALEILTSSRSWMATPSDYNSTIGLRFSAGGRGKASFGYGQTVYADILFHFSMSRPGSLTLTYLHSPSYQAFGGFTPGTSGNSCDISFDLLEGAVTGVTPNAGPFEFRWTLTLDRSPFPLELWLPIEAPLVYYGHPAPLQ